MQKPSIPKGTRDFGPAEMARRNYIFDTIRDVFRLYGFRQIETPAMENLSTLMGKYGEEGDKLLFKILNSGDFMRGINPDDCHSSDDSAHLGRLAAQLCEKGLRYDLTVPFARYVVMHRGELPMPFRRFQMQPVWRADRPQKGRYREFYQCDADIIGSDSLLNEVELLGMLDEVFKRLGIRVAIKLNNRKVLAGIAELIGAPDRLIDITVAIDKIDKIGLDNVKKELVERGLSEEAVERLTPVLMIDGTTDERLSRLQQLLDGSEIGMKGVEELREVVAGASSLGMSAVVELDVSLARGLNYYTGTIIEVKALDYAIGSISGGGRYDNLTGVFGLDNMSGVGVSFGADRIYDVLTGLDLFPKDILQSAKVLFINFGGKEFEASMKALRQVRAAGIAAEIYPDAAKMKKQMKYADDLAIPYVAIIGESELEAGSVTLRSMATGEQRLLPLGELVAALG